MRYFFIEPDKSTGSNFVITGSDARHIKTVLRLKSGDKLGLFDGKGFEYEAKIVDLSTGRVTVSVIRRFPSTAESSVQITVAQGFLKEKKMDGLVRQLSELGIIKWIPFIAERSIPRPDKKQLSARTKRWEKISREAIKQCKRGCIMKIGDTVSFEEILNLSQTADLKIAFWEDDLQPLNAKLPGPDGKINKIYALLGPEGGFTKQEIESARARGFVTASLGPRILRAETATVAACVLLQHLFGDMG
ncbi:MAG: RsmE family RNA methyltransferase [Desulfobacterales bacterium]|jgi:16S rRNA (uracil1498-N3)-methyltransferase|nr:RsmE family RNA methyltransferase [Desulfobacterales bacterium]